MHRAARQGRIGRRLGDVVLVGQFGTQQGGLRFLEVRQHHRHRLVPPRAGRAGWAGCGGSRAPPGACVPASRPRSAQCAVPGRQFAVACRAAAPPRPACRPRCATARRRLRRATAAGSSWASAAAGSVGHGRGHRQAAQPPGASSGTGSTAAARHSGARTASARTRRTRWSRSSWCSRCRPRCRAGRAAGPGPGAGRARLPRRSRLR